MNKKWREWAKDIFSHFEQDFDATLVFEDDNFFIMDWRDKNGSGNLATRYIVDKKKGDLIIKGDAGCCIASWYNPVSVENLVHYINDTGYFIGKIQCSSNKYTYEDEDVEADLEDEKQDYLKMLRDGDMDFVTEEELIEDFERMKDILSDFQLGENCAYPEELTDLMSKYNPDWWEGPFSRLGCRIDKRLYLWTYGYQEGVERLRGKEFVRKDI